MHFESLIWGILAVLVIAALIVLAIQFSPAARQRRRMKKARGRVIYKSRQPSVKFSVKTPPEE